MEVWLIRHGESSVQKDNILCGDLDVPLTRRGIAQATELGLFLKKKNISFQSVYVSPLGRTIETAKAMGFNNFTVMHHLKEWALGEEAHVTFEAAIAAKSPLVKPYFNQEYTPPGGESFSALSARAKMCINLIESENADKIMLIGHAGFFNALLHSLFEIPANKYPFIDIKNCSPIVISHDIIDSKRLWKILGYEVVI